MSKKILIIDIETTDTKPELGKIVEVGIVSLNIETGEIVTLFDQLCHEKLATKELAKSHYENAWVVKNGFISMDEIRNSVDFSTIKDEIQSIINQYPEGATAFNNKFDFSFLESRGIIFPKKLACPMVLLTDIMNLPPTENMKRAGYNTPKPPKAQEAYDYFFGKTDYVEKHRGEDDARHEAKIVYEMIKRDLWQL